MERKILKLFRLHTQDSPQFRLKVLLDESRLVDPVTSVWRWMMKTVRSQETYNLSVAFGVVFSSFFFCEQSDFIFSQTPLVSLGPVLVNNFYPVIRWFFVCAMNEWMKMFVITQVLWHSGTKMPINQNIYRPAMEILACDTVAFKCSIDNIKLLLKINFCASKCYTQF